VVEQIGSPIRRHHKQRETLSGLASIGSAASRSCRTRRDARYDAKVAHLVRVTHQKTELGLFRRSCSRRVSRADYDTDPARRVLWAQFEESVASCRADPKGTIDRLPKGSTSWRWRKCCSMTRQSPDRSRYEPDFLPNGRKIDFVVDRGRDNLYVEVKTVRPRRQYRRSVQKFIDRKKHHPENVNFIVEKEWMGGAIYGNVFASRAHFSITRGSRNAPCGGEGD